MREILKKLLTLLITLISTSKTLKVKKSFFVDGWVMDAVVVNGYMVSEYVGFLKFALLEENDGQNLMTYEHYLNNENLQIYALAADEKNKAVLVAGSSNIIKSYEMKKGTEGIFLREWALPSKSFYPQVLVMRKVPNTDAVLASCDNVTMSVLDLNNNNTFLKTGHTHHLDLIKELEIGGNFYLASGVQRYLVYNDWTTGNHLKLFTTRELDRDGGMHRINGLAYLDLKNGRDWYAIGADNSKIYIYETEQETVVERFDDDNELLIDLLYLKDTEYMMVCAYNKILVHHIFSSKSKIVYEDVPKMVGRLYQHENSVLLTGEYGIVAVFDLEDSFCYYGCESCTKSGDKSACSACSPGFLLTGSTCNPKCSSAQVWTGSACQDKCTTDQYKRNPSVCESCHNSCKTCLLNSELSCTSCPVNKLHTVNGTCADDCGYGSVKTTGEVCKSCPMNCKSCSPLSIGVCTECKNSSYQISSTTKQCFDTCEAGEYLDKRTNECHYCGFGCLNCWGFHEGQCWECVPGFKAYQNTCFSQCPEGTFEIYKENKCHKCDDNCKACHNLDVCMECDSGYILDVMTNTCVKNCTGQGRYFLPPSYCEPCPHGCAECSLEGCSKCADGFTLDGYFCQDGSKAPKFSNFMIILVILLGVFGTLSVYYCTNQQMRKRKVLMKTAYERVKGEAQEGGLRIAGNLAEQALNDDAGENQMSEVSYQQEGEDDFDDVFGGGQDSQIRSKNNPYGGGD